MNQLTRRQVLAGAAGAATLALTACGGSGESDKKQDLDANRAGAMDKFGVGTQFKASEPLTFSIMMLSNAAYPYKADWPFFADSSPPPQAVSASVAAPAAPASTWRLVSWFMETPSSWGAGAALPLDRAEQDAGDEVALDERIDEHDG